jgi:hypothetical protein
MVLDGPLRRDNHFWAFAMAASFDSPVPERFSRLPLMA